MPEEPQIVKTKQFAVKPMNAEEAVLQLELIGHDFFVFRDADSEEVNIVYRRRQGGYGRGRRMAIESDRAEILAGVRHGRASVPSRPGRASRHASSATPPNAPRRLCSLANRPDSSGRAVSAR